MEQIQKSYLLKKLTRYKGYGIVLFSRDQGRLCERHCHDFIEIVLVRGGYTNHVIFDSETGEEKSYGLIRGDFFVIMPSEVHSFCSNRNLQIFNLALDPAFIDKDRESLQTLPSWDKIFGQSSPIRREKLHLLPEEYGYVENLLLKLMAVLEKMTGSDYHELEARSLFYQYLIRIGTHTPENWHQMNGTPDERITQCIDTMESRPEQPFSVPVFAKKAGMSVSLFNRKFKDAVGLSPLQYLISLRLEKAKSYLRSTSIPISEIASLAGFSDSNYMIKYFHAHCAMTPLQYRRMHVPDI